VAIQAVWQFRRRPGVIYSCRTLIPPSPGSRRAAWLTRQNGTENRQLTCADLCSLPQQVYIPPPYYFFLSRSTIAFLSIQTSSPSLPLPILIPTTPSPSQKSSARSYPASEMHRAFGVSLTITVMQTFLAVPLCADLFFSRD
jgi:hypothetical protein